MSTIKGRLPGSGPQGGKKPFLANRWFGVEETAAGPRTVFRFGMYKDQYLADVLSPTRGRDFERALEYLETIVLSFEDLRPDVKVFVENVVRLRRDPLEAASQEPHLVAPLETLFTREERKQKSARDLAELIRQKNALKRKKLEELEQQRELEQRLNAVKGESEW